MKFLTQELVNNKFYYCCWQLKQLRANKSIVSVFFVYFVVEFWKFQKMFYFTP